MRLKILKICFLNKTVAVFLILWLDKKAGFTNWRQFTCVIIRFRWTKLFVDHALPTWQLPRKLCTLFFQYPWNGVIIHVSRGRTVIFKYYRDVVSRKIENHYNRVRPSTNIKGQYFLHDNVPADKWVTAIDFIW
jgi:hypothetical protein